MHLNDPKILLARSNLLDLTFCKLNLLFFFFLLVVVVVSRVYNSYIEYSNKFFLDFESKVLYIDCLLIILKRIKNALKPNLSPKRYEKCTNYLEIDSLDKLKKSKFEKIFRL